MPRGAGKILLPFVWCGLLVLMYLLWQPNIFLRIAIAPSSKDKVHTHSGPCKQCYCTIYQGSRMLSRIHLSVSRELQLFHLDLRGRQMCTRIWPKSELQLLHLPASLCQLIISWQGRQAPEALAILLCLVHETAPKPGLVGQEQHAPKGQCERERQKHWPGSHLQPSLERYAQYASAASTALTRLAVLYPCVFFAVCLLTQVETHTKVSSLVACMILWEAIAGKSTNIWWFKLVSKMSSLEYAQLSYQSFSA